MNEWLAAAIALVLGGALLPLLIGWSKGSASRRSRLGAGSAGIGDALNGFLDPSKKVTIERIEQQREIGDDTIGRSGDKPPDRH